MSSSESRSSKNRVLSIAVLVLIDDIGLMNIGLMTVSVSVTLDLLLATVRKILVWAPFLGKVLMVLPAPLMQ